MHYIRLVGVLLKHKVEFIIVGGVAAVLQGAPLQTFDLDIVHRLNDENAERLLSALKELSAHYRHHQSKITPDKKHVLSTGHQLLKTNMGDLDLLGTIDSGKTYEELLPFSRDFSFFGETLQVLGLAELIRVKGNTGRDKDLAVLPILKHALLLEEE